MDADCLGFPDNNFDYVVTTFTLYLTKREDSFLGQSGSTGLDRWEMRAPNSPQSEDNNFVYLHIVTKRIL